jgi:nitroreductase
MDFYKVIENRISNKTFNSSPIEDSALDRIIKASLMAPSWRNNTCYRFVFVDKQDKKEQLASTIINSGPEASISVNQAPIIAVIVADPSLSGVINNKEYYLVDCGIAMEHLVLAATNEGFGTCWIGSFDESKVLEILNIPSNFKVVAMTPIGRTNDSIEHYSAKDISEHVYYNDWEH